MKVRGEKVTPLIFQEMRLIVGYGKSHYIYFVSQTTTKQIVKLYLWILNLQAE